MRTSGWAKTAFSAAMVMSLASAYQKPPPMHQPLTAAMIGVSSVIRCIIRSGLREEKWNQRRRWALTGVRSPPTSLSIPPSMS